jgi:hypothetical protein
VALALAAICRCPGAPVRATVVSLAAVVDHHAAPGNHPGRAPAQMPCFTELMIDG